MDFDEWAKAVFVVQDGAERGIAKGAWEASQAEEREKCAKICEAEKDAWAGHEYEIAARDCACAIRNQGKPKQPFIKIKFTRVKQRA